MTDQWQQILLAASEYGSFVDAWDQLVMRIRREESVDPAEWREKLSALDAAYARFIQTVPLDMPKRD